MQVSGTTLEDMTLESQLSDVDVEMADSISDSDSSKKSRVQVEKRSEERRVGKECRL